MKSMAIGTCWFHESIDTLFEFVNFFRKQDYIFKQKIDIKIVVFIAKSTIDLSLVEKLRSVDSDIVLLKSQINYYPNKNLGVAAICKYASEANCDYVSVIDSDWCPFFSEEFFTNFFEKVFSGQADLVIPDNGYIVGRSNILVGRTAIQSFYPEASFIKSPFPGSFCGKSKELAFITSNPSYHFDWGGEWDLIRLAIDNNLRIEAPLLKVGWTRHRDNTSKVYDGFQIWRAIFAGLTRQRFELFSQSNISSLNVPEKYITPILQRPGSISAISQMYGCFKFDKSEEQLLIMMVYPIVALILNDSGDVDFINKISEQPYDFEVMNRVSDFALPCLKAVFEAYDVQYENLSLAGQNTRGGYWGEWDINNQTEAVRSLITY